MTLIDEEPNSANENHEKEIKNKPETCKTFDRRKKSRKANKEKADRKAESLI